jgi:hypothetical protein
MFVIPENDDRHPAVIYERLRNACEEHKHLLEYSPDVAFLLRQGEHMKQGRRVLGTCYMPRVNGELSKLFDWILEKLLGYVPTFLFVLEEDFWRDASDHEREILVFHEMLHASQALDEYGAPRFNRMSGEPIWAIRGHDIEEFNAVVARYGAWSPDVVAFIAAARQGDAASEKAATTKSAVTIKRGVSANGAGQPADEF